ncbi:uncharacterized protein LOC117328201 [Pecten maximus]|uniref:uncharacterized protein LOC117328201 n=1 Tax=Pecten maximus TaxID=6579 RepID=UPI001458A590|nr:uncharacterized protein LOC117328201 [Pecten maximus]
MKVVRDVFSDEVFSVTLDGSKTRLHVYRQCQLQVIVAVPESVLDVCVGHQTSSDTNNNEWVLYILTRYQLYVVAENQVKNSKSRKSSQQDETKRGNQEIFSELLGKDSMFGVQETMAVSHPVYQATKEHSLLEIEEEVTSLAVGCDVIAIGLCCEDHYLIRLYLLGELHSGTGRNKLPLQTYVLHRDLSVPYNDQICHKTHPEYGQQFLDMSRGMCLSLHLVRSSDGNSHNQSFSSVLEISKDIFHAVCGFQPSLLNSPLLLICPPEGSLYYVPIKSLDTAVVRLFCHTHYAVVKVGKINLNVTGIRDPLSLEVRGQDRQMGLVVTSQDGRALLVTPGSTQKLEFVEFALPGPVLDVDMYGSKIYHSSGADVFESLIETSPEPAGLSCHTVGLMHAGVQELACLHNSNHTQGGDSDLLLGIPELPLKLIKPAVRRERPAVGAGQTIRNLLHSISMCSKETEALYKQQRRQTERLAQLNMAAFLSTQDPRSPDFPLQFSYSISHIGKQSQQNNNWVMTCHMTNRSDLYLSADWTLMIVLSDNKQEFMSASLPLPSGLGATTGLEFQMVPPASHCCLLRPVEVKTSLVLYSTHSAGILPVMNVLVNTVTLDILFGLVSPEDVTTVTSLTRETSITQLVREMAGTKPISQCKELLLTPTPATVSVHVLNHVLQSDKVAMYNKDPCPLLSYLLKSSSVTPRDSSVTMVTVGGHEIQLTAEGHKLTIHSDRADVAIATRQAIISRLQECTIQSTEHLPDRTAPQQVNSLQQLQDKLTNLHSWSSCTTNLYRNQVLDMYKSLRSTPVKE